MKDVPFELNSGIETFARWRALGGRRGRPRQRADVKSSRTMGGDGAHVWKTVRISLAGTKSGS